ncbi:GntR family transcriptional regulator [uncultured Shewanella sp.]|uniref:GntR family transcriptional regulator n=1 Tax=uncultured Shewanella sp. TaxID=173975 RepID=UPI0026198A16|nr:GntR family transcriptional regulator [uncultured Shewanella sp.]
MKTIDDIWSSISGSAKTRITDPIVGSFLVSWCLCNWNYISLLFFGEGTVSQRVSGFYKYLSLTEVLAFNSLFTIPFLLTIGYLFIFPWVSLTAKNMQTVVNNKLHQQAVDVDLRKVVQQEELNKAKLKANPDKQFLEQNVQLEIDRKKELSELRKQRTARFKVKAEEGTVKLKEATARAEEAESKRFIAKTEEDKKKIQAELERKQFNATSAEVKATLASHRFPSAFLFMSLISDSVKQDGVNLSLSVASELVAAIFGYEDFKSLLDDENFNNESLSSVKYIYYSANKLAHKIQNIISKEESENETLSPEMLFEHIQTVLEELPYEFVNDDDLKQLSVELCENNSHDLLEHEGTSSAIAESDTIFEEVNIEGIESSAFKDGFVAFIKASASGTHRKEADIGGRDMTISVEIKSAILVGKYALGHLEIESVSGGLVDYWQDEQSWEDEQGERDFFNLKLEEALSKHAGLSSLVSYLNDNNIKVGDKLPSERELSNILNSSRALVRESLTRLESFGYIDIMHGKTSPLLKELPVKLNQQEIVEDLYE